MPRNIKKIAHDLFPLCDAVTELSSLITELLSNIKPHINFVKDNSLQYFSACEKASQKLSLSAQLIRKYIVEVNNEADKKGISKD